MASLERRLSTAVHTVHKSLTGPDGPGLRQSLADTAAQVAAEGLGLELRLYEPDAGEDRPPLRPETVAALRDIGRAAGLPVTAHTEFYNWEPDRLLCDLHMAADLGATVLMVHPSRFGMETDGGPDWPAVRDLCARARDLGVTFGLENVPSGLPTLRQALDRVGRDPAATGLGICIDTGHANLSYTQDGVPPVRFVEELRETIVEVHVHDNDGEADQHLPPGDGTLDWPPLLAALRTLPAETVFCLELGGSADPWSAVREARRFLTDGLG